jgi:hypothetical protein
MSIVSVRAGIAANRAKSTKQISSHSTIYPFWKGDIGSETTIRFLPDGDPSNILFWVPKHTIEMPFEGIVGGDDATTKSVTVTITAASTWGMTCPIKEGTRALWENNRHLASLYWRRQSYLYQGLVVSASHAERAPPENSIRIIRLSHPIQRYIEQTLIDDSLSDVPTDFENGIDLKIAKSQKGTFASYQPRWSLKPRALTAVEQEGINKVGLPVLKDYLGTRPTDEHLAAQTEMLAASLNGEPFDQSRWGHLYRAFPS